MKTEKTSLIINDIFEQNKLNDLKYFMKNRNNLNKCNIILIYFFHIIQSAGILTTSIATSYNMKSLIWVGVGLNCVATLIHVFQKTNSTISKKFMKDIQAIKDNNYIDESSIDFETDEHEYHYTKNTDNYPDNYPDNNTNNIATNI